MQEEYGGTRDVNETFEGDFAHPAIVPAIPGGIMRRFRQIRVGSLWFALKAGLLSRIIVASRAYMIKIGECLRRVIRELNGTHERKSDGGPSG